MTRNDQPKDLMTARVLSPKKGPGALRGELSLETHLILLWQPRFQAGHHGGCRELHCHIGTWWNGAVVWYGDGIFLCFTPQSWALPKISQDLDFIFTARPVPRSRKAVPSSLATLVALGEAVTEKCIARGEVFSTPALAKRNRPRGTPSDVWKLSLG